MIESDGSNIINSNILGKNSTTMDLNNKKSMKRYFKEKFKICRVQLSQMHNLHVVICHMQYITFLTYSAQNIFQVVSENKHDDMNVYLHSQHIICKEVEKNTDMKTTIKETRDTRLNILQLLQNYTFQDRDSIYSHGYGKFD